MTVQPNNWSCLPTAFALALDVDVHEIIDYCGHDGSEKLWPEKPEPLCRRAFHIQEMLDFCVEEEQMFFITVERQPLLVYDGEETQFKIMEDNDADERFMAYLTNHRGVLGGTASTGTSHAVAWVDRMCIDPRGDRYELKEFDPRVFFAFF